jgi:uncharacterized protein YceH (UPF0502 family)
VESCLEELARGDDPLVRLLPPRPGQKERRYVQLFSDESLVVEAPGANTFESSAPPAPNRIDALKTEVELLRQDLAQLREEFATFRKQFE